VHEKTISRKTVFAGRILSLEVQEIQMENGKKGLREIVRHRGAVAILARLPDGRFVFVRQFRKPVEKEMLEVVAGNRESNEDPELCARRELREETGFKAKAVRRLGFIHPSPGYVDEKIELFFAEVDTESEPTEQDEDEHVEVVLLTRDEIVGKISRDEIHDSKTLAMWLMYEKRVEKDQQI
jgi:ADP-ribose pyrophosphatase